MNAFSNTLVIVNSADACRAFESRIGHLHQIDDDDHLDGTLSRETGFLKLDRATFNIEDGEFIFSVPYGPTLNK